jgi:hypothetical protein
MVPLRSVEGGVIVRRGHTESSTGESIRLILPRPFSLADSCVGSRPVQARWAAHGRYHLRAREAGLPAGIHGEARRLFRIRKGVGTQDDLD